MQSASWMDSLRQQGQRYQRMYVFTAPGVGMVLPVPIRPADPYDYDYIWDNVVSIATRDDYGDGIDDDEFGDGEFGDSDFGDGDADFGDGYYPAVDPAAHRSSGGGKRCHAAATDEAILGLQEVTAGRSRSESREECAVCLQGFCADETLRAMPCSHAFHQHCISEWLRRNAACPLCRRRLPDRAEEEDDKQKQQRRRIEI